MPCIVTFTGHLSSTSEIVGEVVRDVRRLRPGSIDRTLREEEFAREYCDDWEYIDCDADKCDSKDELPAACWEPEKMPPTFNHELSRGGPMVKVSNIKSLLANTSS